jgi:hypothetical protein
MDNKMIGELVTEAAKVATSKAMKGNPVHVYWIPPTSATNDWRGCWALEDDNRGASDEPY